MKREPYPYGDFILLFLWAGIAFGFIILAWLANMIDPTNYKLPPH